MSQFDDLVCVKVWVQDNKRFEDFMISKKLIKIIVPVTQPDPESKIERVNKPVKGSCLMYLITGEAFVLPHSFEALRELLKVERPRPNHPEEEPQEGDAKFDGIKEEPTEGGDPKVVVAQRPAIIVPGSNTPQ